MNLVQKRHLLQKPRPLSIDCSQRNPMTDPALIKPDLSYQFTRKVSLTDIRPLSSFTKNDEYIEAMVEDLCDWFNFLYKLEDEDEMKPSRFFQQLEDGVILNKHANIVQYLAENYLKTENINNRLLSLKIGNQQIKVPNCGPTYVNVDFTKAIYAFHKRDNVSNFIIWCRSFNIPASLTFETEDLILLKNTKNVVVCLLEIARIGRLFGMEVPDIIQLEEEIDKEMVNEIILSTREEHFEEKNISPNFKSTDLYCDNSKTSHVTIRKKTNLPTKIPFGNSSQRSSLDFTDSGFSKRRPNSLYCENDAETVESSLQNYYKYANDKMDSHCLKVDNSDNESINSHGSQYMIPKYKPFKPVGRVKIYDCFDRTNFVKDKKYREKCDLKSLDERVKEILSECQCTETFPMKRISKGKYQWGDKRTLIFVRILRNHVMVRVGGGWDTLNEFLRKHDHCRKERNGSHKPVSLPQIKGSLRHSVTCPNDLKDVPQDHNSQTLSLSTGNQNGANVLNSIKLNLIKRNNNNNCDSKTTGPISTHSVHYPSLPNCQSEHKLLKNEESIAKLEKKEFNKRTYNNYNELKPSDTFSTNSVHQPLSQGRQLDLKSSKEEESIGKSENKENSLKTSDVNDCVTKDLEDEIPQILEMSELYITSSSQNKNIQNNEKIQKQLSKIPVLKRR